jgi:DNA-binding response OmpR family regulator
VSKVLLLTGTHETAADILPSLSLLDHAVSVAPAAPEALPARTADSPDVVLVDARHHLVKAKELLGQLATADLSIPLLVVISEGAWAAITVEWGADDVLLHTAGPGEVEARIRLAVGRTSAPVATTSPVEPAAEVRSGELVIDESTYSARIRGHTLDLTFKEFELLKFLAQHPKRVFTRSQLLQEVWGYDYFGGTRTVDVHVRRLRAKLGSENEALIGTVRNVGYKFVPAKPEGRRPAQTGAGTAAQAGAEEENLSSGGKIANPGQATQAGQARGRAQGGNRARPGDRPQAAAAGTDADEQAGPDGHSSPAAGRDRARPGDRPQAAAAGTDADEQAGPDGRSSPTDHDGQTDRDGRAGQGGQASRSGSQGQGTGSRKPRVKASD